MLADTVSKLKKSATACNSKVLIISVYVAALRVYMLFAGFTGLRATLGKNQMPTRSSIKYSHGTHRSASLDLATLGCPW